MNNKEEKNYRDSIIFKDSDRILSKTNINHYSNKTILITGANGLFGQYLLSTFALANQKLNTNIKIITISKSGPNKFIKKYNKNNNLKIDLEKKFIFNKKVDYIFHSAGYARPKKWMSNKISSVNINIFGTKELLEIAKKNKAKFIYFSSVDVYGKVLKKDLPIKEILFGNLDSSNKSNAYGEAKRMGEMLCSIYRFEKKVKTYLCRIFHTYGPGIKLNDERVIADFIRNAIKFNKIKIKDKGKAIKNFCYIADAIIMILNIASYGKSFAYNIAGNKICSIYHLAKIIGSICGARVTKSYNKSNSEYLKKSNDTIYASTKKYSKEFGAITYENFNYSVKKIINWMVNKEKY